MTKKLHFLNGENIQNKNGIDIQKNAIMYREQVEEILPEVISKKQSYTLSDIISCCMAVNQKTLDNISKIAVM